MNVDTLRFSGSDGVELVADAAGPIDGVPVLFLHGGGQSRGSWRTAIVAFAKEGYRAIALDLRGHGDSDWAPRGEYGLTWFANDVRMVMKQLGRPAVVIGASFGGLVAMVAFGEDPRPPLLSLVLVDITTQIRNAGTDRVRSFMVSGANGFASVEEAADAAAAYLPHRPRPANIEGLARNLRQRADNRYYWHWDPSFLDGTKESEYELVEDRVHKAVQTIAAPILMICGGASDVVSSRESDAFARILPQAEIVQLAGAHHMVAGDDNGMFAQAVIDFVRRNAPVNIGEADRH